MVFFFFLFFSYLSWKKRKRRDALASSVRESVVGQAGCILTNIKKSGVSCRELGERGKRETNGNGEWKGVCASAWKGRNQERRACDRQMIVLVAIAMKEKKKERKRERNRNVEDRLTQRVENSKERTNYWADEIRAVFTISLARPRRDAWATALS